MMKKRTPLTALCAALLVSLAACSVDGDSSSLSEGSQESDSLYSYEFALDYDQLQESGRGETGETVLRELGNNEKLLAWTEDGQTLSLLVRDVFGGGLYYLHSTDGGDWEQEAFGVEAEQAFRQQNPNPYYEVAAAVAPDGTYYSLRSMADAAPDDFQVVVLKPGASSYVRLDTAGLVPRLEDDSFIGRELLAPTDDRLILVYESDQSREMTVGEYIDEYRDGEPGPFFEGRDREEPYHPVINQMKKALLIDSKTLELVCDLDYSYDERFDFGDGRWFAGKSHLFFKDDNKDTFEFKAYSLETGKEDPGLFTQTNYSNHGIPGYRMFHVSEQDGILWANEEGMQRVAAGGSLVEELFQSDRFQSDDYVLEGIMKCGDGSYLAALYDYETEKTSILRFA